ncbi:globin family protein [uncultured Enterovirga sp.]|uniref:globin family protein n=1 Tax=uncultured Enterovirga sp. TaxID=2026352 RepID=UPI0035CBA4C3
MSPDDIARVQASFEAVKPISDTAAGLFYGRLFETAPETRSMFPDDMSEQRRKLMATLAVVVAGLDRLPSILPSASALAKKHVGWGVQAEHYPIVGTALLWTLEQGLGPQAWTPELKASWEQAYRTVSGYMIGEAYGAAAEATSS